MNKLLLVIQGPTASGKTALAIEIAKKLKTVIFSADSRQFYKELHIGTAKPTKEEQEGIYHYFVDSHSVNDNITSASYVNEVLPLLNKEFENNQVIILVGGSGMYIDALCYGLDDLPVNSLIKNELIDLCSRSGIEVLLKELSRKDPEYYDKVDKQNSVRIIRALEVIRISGKTYSSFLTNNKKSNHQFDILKVTIDLDRAVLYDRINRRVEIMLEKGLESEAKEVEKFKQLQALQTVGYSEWFDYFEGKYSREETIERIKQNTRRYAKRQLTWFRRDKSAFWLKGDSLKEQMEETMSLLNHWKDEN
jgi:tRNA dimethylallyltransferase